MNQLIEPPQSAGFRSFWMGGFEAACHINTRGKRMDMIDATRHDALALTDYELLQSQGLRCARDAFRWHLVDRGAGGFDFSSVVAQLQAAITTNTQVIWSLSHYGYPSDLDLFSNEFIKRYVRFAKASLRLLLDHTDDVPYITPINEISFFSWAASRQVFHPFAEGCDHEIKRQLVRASVEACCELLVIDSRCRFVYPEPINNIVTAIDRPDQERAARELTQAQFESWDMIAGMLAPELGGSRSLLDIIGMNFYHSNQWELEGPRLRWEEKPRDPRWKPLHEMIERIWERYRRPLFLAETSHVGVGRADWTTEIAEEVDLVLKSGIPFEGICLFPIIDRHDWEDPTHWHNSGLWEVRTGDGSYGRELNPEFAASLSNARLKLPG